MVSVEPPPDLMGAPDHPASVPQSEGIPAAIVELTTVVPFNDLDALETAFVQHAGEDGRSEEHTSELQSRLHLVCRLLLEKKKKQEYIVTAPNNEVKKYQLIIFMTLKRPCRHPYI